MRQHQNLEILSKIDKCKKAIDNYEHQVIELDSTLDASIKSFGDYQRFAEGVRDAVEEESKETAKAVDVLSKQLTGWVNQSSELVARFQSNYDNKMNPVINTTEQFINKLATALETQRSNFSLKSKFLARSSALP